jgi:ATP-dependent exoDNAse (exonuclease V) alpha subunit
MTQNQAFDIMRLGNNVFLTGAAGSGKSHLLRRYIAYLRKNKIHVGVTASTGIAATQINGRTIHSWAGIGIHRDLADKEISKLFYNDDVRERITKARVLIIDEVSMLGANLLDLVDRVCKKLRQSEEPFGGIQVILCGDFFQLPPIPDRESGARTEFAFSARAWQTGQFLTCYLEKQYRQTDDNYLDILNSIRHSRITDALLAKLFDRRDQTIEHIKKPTKLYTHNVDVDAINARELSAIEAEPVQYHMQSKGEPNLIHGLKKYCLAPEILELKIGAVVMFTQNNRSKGYVNGTLGTVIGFDVEDNHPVVKTTRGKEIVAEPGSWKIEEDDEVIAEIIQIPIRLAWAITVHKSQGMSLDAAQIDLSKAFTEGMGYVALSRVRTLAGLRLDGLNEMALRVNPEITAIENDLRRQSAVNAVNLKKLDVVTKRQLVRDFATENRAVESDY